jgi:hypothetical protein
MGIAQKLAPFAGNQSHEGCYACLSSDSGSIFEVSVVAVDRHEEVMQEAF